MIAEALQWVVVTDAEIFGRYKIQRPRRLKSAHAVATRSIMQVDFSDLEEGDCVVHLQHGIGRFQGLRRLPAMASKPGQETEQGAEYLVIEYASKGWSESPPKLYVPVSEAHLVSKYIGGGVSAASEHFGKQTLADHEKPGRKSGQRPGWRLAENPGHARCRIRFCF